MGVQMVKVSEAEVTNMVANAKLVGLFDKWVDYVSLEDGVLCVSDKFFDEFNASLYAVKDKVVNPTDEEVNAEKVKKAGGVNALLVKLAGL